MLIVVDFMADFVFLIKCRNSCPIYLFIFQALCNWF